ncbi:MAG: SusC/RagA family TonB-linked outer membrane protein [Tannerella sp.]|jgi:TonB-linked SusC/RagA family outer membrane protein|nr:SusC/RagA family TonB-linked outer membrane protein [Tannerella sp.]
MKKKLTKGMKDAKFEWMKRGMILSVLLFVMGTGMVFAADGYPPEAGEPAQSSGRITGTVVDQAGEPVVGANVVVKGRSATGTVTDAEGRFTLQVAAGVELEISFLGYRTQTVKAAAGLTVTLEEDAQALDEVVVTALGITREAKALGYAMSTISASELTKVGTPNLGTALYGKASGLQIVSPPGGAASGVSFTVRGLSSINGNTQPLIVLNGVPIRSGNNEGETSTGKFANFRSEGRIRSNGLVDINPEDIETLSILKGAAATALYGSEGANGVVLLTSKKTKGSGMTVDFNVTLEANTMAYLPKIQSEYGPGLYSVSRSDEELDNNGFRKTTYKGTEYKVPYYATNVSFGPRYDGSTVLYWDGNTRPYSAINADPWNDLFRTGFDQIYNVAINHGAEKSNTRFSYTYLDEVPNGLTGSYSKHNFNLVGSLKFNDRLSVDYSGSYIVQKVHNRAQRATSAYDSFSDLFGSFTDVALMKTMYQTSLGYKNRVYTDPTLTPDEGFAFSPGNPTLWVQNYLWKAYRNNDYETSQRFIASVAPAWKITDFLTARARISSDLTADKIEYKTATERPLVLEDPSGGYEAVQKQYSIIYGDGMLVFDKKFGDVNLSASAGWQARTENMMLMSARTDGGLTVENQFLLSVSRNQTRIEQTRMELLKTAALATVDLAYGDFVFLGLTGRQEKSSTLPRGSNSYFYPSSSLSFLYTDAFRDALPSWYNFGKLRFSYGVVGNAPDAYAANIVYDASSNRGVQWSTIPGTLGNEKLRPEKITEYEAGIENKLLGHKLGFEVSYYHRRVSDMLIQQPLVTSDGASNMWVNVGEMVNKGVEFSVNATPFETKDWRWEIRTNFAFNKNEVTKLAEGVDFLRNSGSFGNTGGGANVRSYVGRPMGDIYVNRVTRVEDPNSPYYGEKIVLAPGYGESDGWGYYLTSTGEAAQECVGNINPKVVGGLGTSLSYKRLSLDIMTDFRIGGYVLNNADLYPNCRGLTERSLQYRDAEHGGLEYVYKGRTLHNGWIVPGVIYDEARGEYRPNDIITSVDSYYYLTYNWGNSDPGTTYEFSVVENSYWKVRELSVGYDVPIKSSAIKRLTASVFGRNLFYLYKSLKDIDPESTNGGTTWGGQAGVGYSSAPSRTFGLALRATF